MTDFIPTPNHTPRPPSAKPGAAAGPSKYVLLFIVLPTVVAIIALFFGIYLCIWWKARSHRRSEVISRPEMAEAGRSNDRESCCGFGKETWEVPGG
mgnify:FL=1